jgi:hypothetical protein
MASLLNKRLLIIAPTAPPEVCGVSDYAYQTAQELAKFYDTVDIGVERLPSAPTTSNGIRIDRWQHLIAQVATDTHAADVLLNYTPTSYAWSGLPVELLLALRRFTTAKATNRLFVFFHETWNGSSNQRLHQAVRSQITRWSMHRIGELAGGVAVVNAEQQHKLELLLNRNDVRLNAIGSNILPPSLEAGLQSIREPGSWLVFGLSHTRLWALEAHLPLLQAMYKRGSIKRIYSIGPTDTSYAKQERELIANNLGPDVLEQLGALEPAEVSQQMLRAEAALMGLNIDGLKKSGTFAALAAHAVPVICEVDTTLQQPPGAAFLQPQEVLADPTLVFNAESERRRRQMHEWFWATRSWSAIGQSMKSWLQASA